MSTFKGKKRHAKTSRAADKVCKMCEIDRESHSPSTTEERSGDGDGNAEERLAASVDSAPRHPHMWTVSAFRRNRSSQLSAAALFAGSW